jgi:hypothetical protein
MKLLKYISYVLLPCLIMGTMLITSCEQNEDGTNAEKPEGTPVVKYIRLADPVSSDSLIASATLGTGLVIVGENLGGTRAVLFNDKEATLLPVWVTNKTIFVDIPSNAPAKVTDILYLVNDNKDTLKFPFKVAIPAPVLTSAVNEWPKGTENLVIKGNYFFSPLTVTFTGGVVGSVKSISQTQLEVVVPAGATEGPVTVKTNFGEAVSTFHIWDKRNIVLNFDDKNPNGWRIGMKGSTEGIDGSYLMIKGNVAANQRDEGPGAPAESPYAMEYWGGKDAARSDNFYPLYTNSYRDYVLKFETKVKKWKGGYLNLCLSSPEHTDSNQEIWGNALNARAIWGPWAKDNADFNTGGKWITVTIPLTEFQYSMGKPGDNIVYTAGQKFNEANAGSFSTWMLGSPESDGKEVEIHMDNIRFVKP